MSVTIDKLNLKTGQTILEDTFTKIDNNFEKIVTEINGQVNLTELKEENIKAEANITAMESFGDVSTLAQEVTSARNGEVNLDTRIDKIDNKIGVLTTDLLDITNDKISTTTGQSWSKEYNNVKKLNINGTDNFITSTPNYARKKIVIYGSSVATGWHSTGDNYGWAKRLGDLLTNNYDYTVINHSIPGDTTLALIGRFYKDIVLEKPDIVIIGLSLANEGIQGSNPEGIYTQYKNNMIKLIYMCRQQGIIPVIASCYPNGGYTDTHYKYIKQMNRDFEDIDVACFNLLGAVDDGTGKWISSVQVDYSHPNDAGHEEMFRSIPPTLFDNLKAYGNTPLKSQNGGILMGIDTTNLNPMITTISDPIHSFTVSFWTKDLDGSQTKVFFSFAVGDEKNPRIRQTTNYIEYYNNSDKSSDTSSILSNIDIKNDRKFHHIALTYNYLTTTVSLYVDGILIGSIIDKIDISMTDQPFVFAGNCKIANYNAVNSQFKDFVVYRTCLNNEQIKDLYNGNILKSSLEIFAPLSDKSIYVGSRLVNLAPTNSYLKVNSPTIIPSVADVNVVEQILIGGGAIYTDNGTLKFKSANGTVTQIALL